jgi:hypothetical protein
MSTLRATALIWSLTSAAFVVPYVYCQDPAQSTDKQADQTQSTPSVQANTEPTLSPLPAITTSLPEGMLTFNAACFTVSSSGQLAPIGAFNEGECYSKDKSGNLIPNFTHRVSLRDDVAGQFTQLGTQADSNYVIVQKAVLHAIVQVLADQSIKADQVASIVKTTADQITAKVTENLQKNVQTLVTSEVEKQIKALNITPNPQKPKQPKPTGQ